ncbi:MAG TPA: hypothetical protein VET48_14760, partial [Steroidobacteraceae bacterium]|nr:hypothetical protein [Steroidobacteraceae bacterium]
MGALTECLLDTHGIGELSLWIPTLRNVSNAKRTIAFVAPPFLPYPPALAHHHITLSRVILIEPKNSDDTLWAAEQIM